MQISLKTQDKPNKIGVIDNYCGFVFPVSLFILLRKKNRNARSEGAHSTVIPAHLQFQHSAGYGKRIQSSARQGWRMLLIPALGSQRQVDLCEFEASLVYRMSSRTVSKTTEKPCLERQNKTKK